VIRRLDPQRDVPRTVRLQREIEAAAGVEQEASEEQLRADLQWPGYDITQDGWVVEQPGAADRLIAEAYTLDVANTPRAKVHVGVHPHWRRQELGRRLLALTLGRAREQGKSYVSTAADSALPAAGRFLRRAGFAPVVDWVLMRAPAELPLEPARWPAGYTVRTYREVQNPAVVAEALNRGFIGHWENRERPLAEIVHRLAGPHVRPAGIFLAFGPAGEVAGICWADYDAAGNAQRGEAVGHIWSLGVAPEHRRHGLGRALLLAGMAWLRAEGQPIVELDAVGNNELALPLYHSAGFAVRRRGSEYRLYL